MAKKQFKNKGKLIQAAIKHFSRYSYKQASLNQIIEDAGISKGSFYFHFKNKQELYTYLFDMVAEKKVEYFTRHLNQQDLSHKDIFEVLKVQSKVGLKFAADYPQYYQLGLKFFEEKDENIYHLIKQRFSGNYKDFLLPAIKRALENEELREDLSPDYISKLLIYLLTNFDTIFSSDIDFSNLDEVMALFDKYIDFIKYGLAKRSERHTND